MASTRRLLQYFYAFFLLFSCSQALKFDLHAYSSHDQKPWRCIQNFVNRNTLVVVTATISGHKGDGMLVNMHVRFSRPISREFVFLVEC